MGRKNDNSQGTGKPQKPKGSGSKPADTKSGK